MKDESIHSAFTEDPAMNDDLGEPSGPELTADE